MIVRTALQSKGNKIGQTKSSVLNANEKKNLSKSRMYVYIEKEVEKKFINTYNSICKLKLCVFLCLGVVASSFTCEFKEIKKQI